VYGNILKSQWKKNEYKSIRADRYRMDTGKEIFGYGRIILDIFFFLLIIGYREYRIYERVRGFL
jgi:hypothetical protein